jgi:magnesium transporter
MNEVYEHIKEAIELSETYREMIMDLMELFYTSTSYKLNEIIKVLTIISTIFIPLTFIVGVYGMNFKYIPELYYKWSYPVLWGINAYNNWLNDLLLQKKEVVLIQIQKKGCILSLNNYNSPLISISR